jgi:hypothetical protein
MSFICMYLLTWADFGLIGYVPNTLYTRLWGRKMTHKYGISNILLDILNLLPALLVREPVHVEDSHLLDNSGLSGFAGAEEQQSMRRTV